MNDKYCDKCGIGVCKNCTCAYNLKEDSLYIGEDGICWKCNVTKEMVRSLKKGVKLKDGTVLKGETMDKSELKKLKKDG